MCKAGVAGHSSDFKAGETSQGNNRIWVSHHCVNQWFSTGVYMDPRGPCNISGGPQAKLNCCVN